MKINVRIRGEWLLIPCRNNKNNTIEWLCQEALRRYIKQCDYSGDDDHVVEMRKTQGGSLLFPYDAIEDVLDENDFVYAVLQSDLKKIVKVEETIMSG
ncbi:histidine ammonia-lyase-like [Anneissia japonica]|uniref:histidine ammonia-lyase-like n=1 Tax=Anneissia japonica TaxID=1529436 RepID=UPI001425A20D|nr:histidine ammonia-lyase-like [Anneissia japonica]